MGKTGITPVTKGSQSSQKSKEEVKESKESISQINKNKDLINRILIYQNDLEKWAFKLTRNKEDSEDLVQETYYKALYYMNKFRDEISLKAWLFTILKYTFINNYRRKQSNLVNYVEDITLFDFKPTHETIESGIREKDIISLFDKINQRDAFIFYLYISGYKYEEISTLLNIKLGTVKSRISRARVSLTKLIKR
jgi:RNA polymerase sigma-70 factor, ECF subfamily